MITLDGKSHPEELAFARSLMAGWPTEMRCIPGNHDMGDGSGERPLDLALLSAYCGTFGPDYRALGNAHWTVLAINAQLLGTGSAQEEEQWLWLEATARGLGADARVALLVHRPLARLRPGEETRPGRYVDAAACRRLLDGPLKRSLRLVGWMSSAWPSTSGARTGWSGTSYRTWASSMN